MLTSTHIFWSGAAFAFVFGALIGSFLNVVIYRVPLGLSIVSPGSACPACETPVRWYDNIPIVSWFVLRGKCRSCRAPFSIRYAGVELLTAVLAGAAWWQAASWMMATEALPSTTALAVVGALFLLRFTLFAFLVAIAFIDLDHFIIPHVISLPGIALGIASPWIVQALVGPVYAPHVMWPPVTPLTSLVGAILGFVMILVLFYAYFAVRGIEGLGGGDATLMALIGAWLGWPALVFVLFAASFQGVLAAGVTMLFGGSFVRDAGELFAEEPDGADDGEVGGSEEDATVNAAEAGDEPDLEREQASSDGEESSEEGEVEADSAYDGKLAVPFGPFLTLAALEFAVLGPYLPDALNMMYLY